MNNIAKRIFYCWFGDTKPQNVLNCINNWKEKLPEYEIVEINEQPSKYFNLEDECKNNLWLDICYKRKMWAYVADYARLKVLYENGGVYFDTDITVEKDLSELLEENKLVLGWENECNINAAVIIAPVKCHLIKEILDFYNRDIWESNLFILPSIISYLLRKNFKLNPSKQATKNSEIMILPPDYFYPIPFSKKEDKNIKKYITANTCTVHWWNASWGKPENMFFLKNKHRLPLDKIDMVYNNPKLYKKYVKKDSFKNILFSVEDVYTHKIITLLGIKIKFKINF